MSVHFYIPLNNINNRYTNKSPSKDYNKKETLSELTLPYELLNNIVTNRPTKKPNNHHRSITLNNYINENRKERNIIKSSKSKVEYILKDTLIDTQSIIKENKELKAENNKLKAYIKTLINKENKYYNSLSTKTSETIINKKEQNQKTELKNIYNKSKRILNKYDNIIKNILQSNN